jgi:L-ascorbate metabolism protein UlaG (beta-lactamase superfamily)
MHPFAGVDVAQGRLAVHWFGQNSYAFRSPGGAIVLLDPYFPHERPAEKFIHREPPLREDELHVDAVLMTHDHSDHTHPETLGRIRAAWPEAVFVGPKESAARLDAQGVRKEPFVVIDAGSAWSLRDFAANFVYSKPPGGDPQAGIKPPDVTHLGVVLACGPVRLYITGDLIHTFADMAELVSPVRALRPAIGFLTCHPTEGEFPFFDGCVKLAQRVGLKIAFPSHYDCFVKRTYDPVAWADAFQGSGIEARVIGYNRHSLLP